jgi:hypothetical protein
MDFFLQQATKPKNTGFRAFSRGSLRLISPAVTNRSLGFVSGGWNG